MNHEIIAEIRDLSVVYHTEEDDVHALNGVSLKLYKGETLGLVGETGAGKSALLSSIKLLVGDRASGDQVRDGAEGLSVEGRLFSRPMRGNFPTGTSHSGA